MAVYSPWFENNLSVAPPKMFLKLFLDTVFVVHYCLGLPQYHNLLDYPNLSLRWSLDYIKTPFFSQDFFYDVYNWKTQIFSLTHVFRPTLWTMNLKKIVGLISTRSFLFFFKYSIKVPPHLKLNDLVRYFVIFHLI